MTSELYEEEATTARLAALDRLDVLDSPAEVEFDDIVCLAATLCDTPVGLVGLLTEGRQRFKARLGFPQRQTPLDQSICKYAMSQEEVLVIPDLRRDPRTQANILVTQPPCIRFYAGASLRDRKGVPIGSVCVMDTEPRPEGLTEPQKVGLSALARQAAALLEARRLLILQASRKEAEHAATRGALQEERRLAELREQFIAVLSHDLRNPLAAIGAGLRLIERDPASDEAAEIRAMMKLSTARMEELIENTLDFTRIRLGGGIVVQRSADAALVSVIEQVVAEVRASHPERHIEARIDLTEPVTCDPDRVGQLVSNLLSNAVTHGGPAQPILVTATTLDGTFMLSVANGGQPIPPAVLGQIFQPFSGGATPEREGLGLGLGLYIAAEIARAHGDSLDVTTTQEQTCFVFQMPAVPV